jgi:multicomponent Na+:H+ antiporter subunit D
VRSSGSESRCLEAIGVQPEMNNLVPLLVVIPLGVGFLIPLAIRLHPRLADLLSNLAFLGLVALSLSLTGHQIVYHMGGWPTPNGIDLRVDGLTTLMLLMINGLALIVGLYSVAYLQRSMVRYRYYSLLMFVVAGTNGVVLTGDLFNLYVFMEITAIASYALVAFCGEAEDFEASFKYAVLGGLSSSIILIGIGLVYGMTGTLNMTHLASRLSETSETAPIRFALALFFCGFGMKAALVPFHTWLPDAYPAAPAPISALLSGVVSKVTGIYVLARLLFNVFGMTDDMLMLMRWMGGITMVVGGLLALGQWDIKRLFAYSSVSQAGLIVLALGLGTTWGVVGGLFHLINHAVFKPLLFLGSGQVEVAAGTRDLRKMGQLRSTIPITAATSLVGSLSLAGIPPFNGFWSKLIIVVAAIQAGHTPWAMAVVVISIVALAYQLKVQTEAFYSEAPAAEEKFVNDAPERVREPILIALPMIILAVGCVALSLLALTGLEHPFLVGPAAEVLMQGAWVQ